MSASTNLNSQSRVAEQRPEKLRGRTRFRTIAKYASYYGLAITIAWIGALKFTAAEAARIAILAQHSPIFGWATHLMSAQAFSNGIGTVELVVAVLLATRPWSKKLAVFGGILAVGMFLSTLSFMFTTPGVSDGLVFGFLPNLSAVGQFLLKDIVLLGVSLQILADALTPDTL